VNILIDTNCNQRCEFCFERTAFTSHARMTLDEVRTVASFMQENGLRSVGVLGGEPTLHPDLAAIVREFAERSIVVTLFTNGLGNSSRLEECLGSLDAVLVNCATPAARNGGGASLQATLGRLRLEREERRARGGDLGIDLGITVMDVGQDVSFVLGLAREYEVRTLRFDLAKPAPDASNRYLDPFKASGVGAWITQFVKQAEAAGVKTSADCPVPLCAFTPDELAYLEKTVIGFRGFCRPPMDVFPGLRLVHCLPLAHVCTPLDLSEVGSMRELRRFFNGVVRSQAWRHGLPEECRDCDFHHQRRCQGYCPAFGISSARA
jgi:hypothetical protein